MKNNSISFFQYLKFKKHCKTILTPHRFRHSVMVGKMLYKLMPNENKYLCFCLGLGHDLAHHYKFDDNIKIIKDNNIELYEGEREREQVLHSPVAMVLFKQEFPFLDEKYYSALRHHTIVKKGLSDIALNLYVADKIDKSRKYIDDNFRKSIIKEKNVEKRVFDVMKRQNEYLAKNNQKMLNITECYFKELEKIFS